MTNYFDKYDWETMLNQHAPVKYDIAEYREILCPRHDWPDFLDKYIELTSLQRLAGVGLLCGTDWTPLYKNRFYYSRLDHSIGVALIVWHFTHNKAQTIAGLLHDISTPVFSHVSDFRKGDALTQTATEEPTAAMVRGDEELVNLLAKDGLSAELVEDYHIYPIADNEIPQLSADRLEYMFPSGMALDGSWTMEEIRLCYNDLVILKNEDGADELGFKTLEIAELYCEHFCMIGHILQLNENKLTLQLLGQIMNLAEKAGVLSEDDFMRLSEKEVMGRLSRHAELVSASSNGSLPLRSTAARRLAQNAPLEHFDGLQPSLPKFGMTGISTIRITSDKLRLPNYMCGYYGCSEFGLVLVTLPDENNTRLPKPPFRPQSGDLISVKTKTPDSLPKDEKSGALIVKI